MHFRTLGQTQLRVSAIGVGTWQLSGPLVLDGEPDGFPDLGFDHAVRLIQECGSLGMNLIDTAEIYGDGEGERRVGVAIRGNREQWIVSTKFGVRKGPDGRRMIDFSQDAIMESAEGSLRRLQTEYIDLFLFQRAPALTQMDDAIAAAKTLQSQGKVRFLGVSWNDAAAIADLNRRGGIDVVLFSQSMLTHPTGMMRVVTRHHLGGMIRGVLESGRFSDRHLHHHNFPEDDIRSARFTECDFSQTDAFAKLARHDRPLAETALRYVLGFETSHTVLLGGRTIDDFRAASRVAQLPPLDHQTMQEIRAIRKSVAPRPWIGRRLARRGWHVLSSVASRVLHN